MSNLDIIKNLRSRTGVGLSDCKNALKEANGNEEEAIKIIQKKGLVKLAKKAGAIITEGVIYTYLHPGNKLGVILELNCQTDFVAKNEEFLNLAENLGMHIASMNPLYVSIENISENLLKEQREIFLEQMLEEQRKNSKNKPEHILNKIIDGKLEKWKKDICLLNQVFVMDESKSIQTLLNDLSMKVGEKIIIRRFNRYELGEGL